MSTEENKAIASRYLESINTGNLDIIDEVVASNYVGHVSGEETHGPEELKQSVGMYVEAFPDISFTVEDEIAEGDKVVMRWTMRGTHRGGLMGIAPTGKQITVTGISVHRIEGGKVVDQWDSPDRLGLMQQLGMAVIPGPRLLVRTLIRQAKKLRSRLPTGRSG